jgi:Tfp pilus assembly protein PilX
MSAQSKVAQRGAVLAVSLIMLVVITLLVVGAYSMSAVNIKAVGNMQSRDEAISAANEAIERLISSSTDPTGTTVDFTSNPVAQGYDIDVNNDGVADYQVNFAAPACLTGTQVAATNPPPSSVSLGGAFNLVAATFYRTVWELVATVTDLRNSGVSVRIHQGVVVLVNQARYTASCPN